MGHEMYFGEDTHKTRTDIQSVYRFCLELLMQKGMKKGALGLDIGSNQGFGLMVPESQCFQVVASDICMTYVEATKANTLNSRLVTLDARRLPFPVATLDFVFAHQIIEHVEQRDQAVIIKEIHQALNSEYGVACISTPNADSRPRWTRPYSDDHRHELQKEEFINLLSAYFSTVEIYGSGFLPTGIKGLAYQIARNSPLNEIYFHKLPRRIRLYLRDRLAERTHSGEIRRISSRDNPRSLLAICTNPKGF